MIRQLHRPTRRLTRVDALRTTAFGGGLTLVLVGAVILLPILFYGIVSNNAGISYMALAFFAALIPLGVGLTRGRHFDPFEPINLIALALLFGSALRSIWMLTSLNTRVEFLMMGTDFESVVANMPLVLLSVLSLSIGYLVLPHRFPLERLDFVRNFRMSKQRFWLAVWLTVLIAAIGIPWMVQQYGIDMNAGLFGSSSKKVAQFTDDSGEIVYGTGFQRFMAFATIHGFSLLTSALIAKILKPTPVVIAAIAGTGGLAALIFIVTSSRSAIVVAVLNLAIFAHYYRRLPLKAFLSVGIASVFVLSALGALREQNQTGNLNDDATAFDRVIGSGNSIDFIRTSAIIDRVPSTVDYLYGQSYYALLTSIVPRSFWPDKPQVGLGSFVKGEIFHQDVRLNGWPSGMIAEGWINFGFVGLIIPMFLFGMLLRYVYESILPLLGNSYPLTLIYAVSIWRMGFGTIGLNFAHGLLQAVNVAAPVTVLLIIARTSVKHRPPTAGFSSKRLPSAVEIGN